MTLIEFINHLKHKSIKIVLTQDCYGTVFIGDVGTYLHWVYKSKMDNVQIVNITFTADNAMIIELDPDVDLSIDDDYENL